MTSSQRKYAVLVLGCLLAGVLPVLRKDQLILSTVGILLGYASYRIGSFLWEARILYLDFKGWDDRLDQIVRERRRKPYVRLIER